MQDFLEDLGNEGYPRHKPQVLTTFSSGTERLRVHSWLFTNESAERGKKSSGYARDPSKDPATLSLQVDVRFFLPFYPKDTELHEDPTRSQSPKKGGAAEPRVGAVWQQRGHRLEPSLQPCRSTKTPSASPAPRHRGQGKHWGADTLLEGTTAQEPRAEGTCQHPQQAAAAAGELPAGYQPRSRLNTNTINCCRLWTWQQAAIGSQRLWQSQHGLRKHPHPATEHLEEEQEPGGHLEYQKQPLLTNFSSSLPLVRVRLSIQLQLQGRTHSSSTSCMFVTYKQKGFLETRNLWELCIFRSL